LTQACAPGQPRSGFRGVEHPASQAGKLDSSASCATPFFNPFVGTTGFAALRRVKKCPPQKGVAFGHLTVSAMAGAALRDGGTPPKGGSQ